jgi:cytochrome c
MPADPAIEGIARVDFFADRRPQWDGRAFWVKPFIERARMKSLFQRFQTMSHGIAALSMLAGAAFGDDRGCPALKDADFTMTTLASQATANLAEPLRMAFDMSSGGDVDIYFIEKAGKVRKYNAATKAVTTLGTIGVKTTGEHGLLGIALDPAFKTNKRLYVFYGTNQTPYQFRLSRFTLAGETMDMASEKIMIRIPADFNSWHTGGALAFDAKGDLWITVGDNKSDESGSPNTNDLRGKILRIHPKDDGTYSIPAGNLFAEGTDKTKPEIYIMGNRNPYSIALDPKTGWVAWGEVGPDGFGVTEEWNVATKPGNYGWPYFAGNNMVLKSGKVPSAPVNNSTLNTGMQNLPPAVPGSFSYPQGAAITGPIYRYDSYPQSPVKMPPHFDGVWFVTDFNNYGGYGQLMDTMSLDSEGKPKKIGRVWPQWKLARPTEMLVGPDGAFYAMNYAGYFSTVAQTAIMRIEYKGSCRPVGIRAGEAKLALRDRLDIQGSRVSVRGQGVSELKVMDMAGRTVFSEAVNGEKVFELSSLMAGKAGLYAVSLSDGSSALSRKVLLAGH